MSLQGHVKAIQRHMKKAAEADSKQDHDREIHFARVAYRNLCAEAERKTEKQVQRDSPEAYRMWKNGVSGL